MRAARMPRRPPLSADVSGIPKEKARREAGLSQGVEAGNYLSFVSL